MDPVASILNAAARRRERSRVRARARQTAPAAYDQARELCAAVGPVALAHDYGLPQRDPTAIARAFARVDFREEVRVSATAGALKGFEDYDA